MNLSGTKLKLDPLETVCLINLIFYNLTPSEALDFPLMPLLRHLTVVILDSRDLSTIEFSDTMLALRLKNCPNVIMVRSGTLISSHIRSTFQRLLGWL